MVSVQYHAVAPGSCSWCRKDKNEVFTVTVDDFKGKLCRCDLDNLINLKLRESREKAGDRSSPSGCDDASGSTRS
jgi:hypothetical protein